MSCPSRSGDHPRMRGEHKQVNRVHVKVPGSSPHARGALRWHVAARGIGGIIPACAGSTISAYPAIRCRLGSSPHARGARPVIRGSIAMRRIIPACAGSTGASSTSRYRGRDHPRMRGEHAEHQHRQRQTPGSSPHARGAHQSRAKRCTPSGIIPACAGSTPTWWPGARRSRDHPRMHGEHSCSPSRAARGPGSSPHARGARGVVAERYVVGGIIPACAGSTGQSRRTWTTSWDHPRMRGEHPQSFLCGECGWGSSPHARGAPEFKRGDWVVFGIIPACAGSTRSCARPGR